MRTWLRALALVVTVLAGSTARSEVPPDQGQRCDAKKTCPAKLTCVPRKDGNATCELKCSTNGECPSDQRCVNDANARVCRPITDENMDFKKPPF